ncbi:hypothetical protein E3P96_03538 [Wallemia ichthyophaga]|nr:hypothetical protein E3P96_03538 [Wallemia ichthyophaga]
MIQPISTIKVAVKNMGRYLSENAENVVVVHCKAGKGRSGTIACCLLLTLAELPPPSRHVSNRPRHSYYPSGNEIDADQSRPSQLKIHQGHAKSDASAVQRLVEPHIIPSAASSTSHLTTTEATENSNSNLPPALERAEDVLKLHTRRRMKTKESNKTKEKDVSRWRMGVSIPSQRRFIEYFARELANEVVHNSHNVRVWRVTVRLSENFGKLAKTMYTDDYVEALQDGVNNDDESFSIQDDRWDKEKMVHRFAETDEYTTEEDDQS